MSGHLPFIIGFGVFVGSALILIAYALRVERRKPDETLTGDPINPEALTQWRKANKARFQ